LGLINALAAILVPIGVYVCQAMSEASPKAVTGTHWTSTDTFLVVSTSILFLSNGVSLLAIRNKHRKHEIIDMLSSLQGEYILEPKYVSAVQHASHSKEGDLSQSGTIDILTNSLKYDLFYSEAIATNIIRGAKYIYVLPKTKPIIRHLRNYITTLSESIQKVLAAQGANGTLSKLEELRKSNLEFWFFDGEHPCLYNFAIFRQPAEGALQSFEQYWWYINPSDTKQDSHMLIYEITVPRDKSALDDIFGKLKKDASKKTGQDVFINREDLSDWIEEGQ
jgi:hypothetical protein